MKRVYGLSCDSRRSWALAAFAVYCFGASLWWATTGETAEGDAQQHAVLTLQLPQGVTCKLRRVSPAGATDAVWVGAGLVTNREYGCFDPGFVRKRSEAAGDDETFLDRPVTGISWQEAQAFCRWLGALTKGEVRLPTTAELKPLAMERSAEWTSTRCEAEPSDWMIRPSTAERQSAPSHLAPTARHEAVGFRVRCRWAAGAPDSATGSGEEVPMYVGGSPFDKEYRAPAIGNGKQLWADSFLWEKAPDLEVEEWLGPKPDTTGKYLLIEFWATWCPPCRRSIPVLNGFHHKFGDELVVIGISDQTAEAVRKLTDPRIEYFSAIDTQARMKTKLGVRGIPHAILVEPGGHVIWEGFPLLKGYELTEQIIERALAVGRQQRKQ